MCEDDFHDVALHGVGDVLYDGRLRYSRGLGIETWAYSITRKLKKKRKKLPCEHKYVQAHRMHSQPTGSPGQVWSNLREDVGA